MKSFLRILKLSAHAAALAFCAFWLVATSAATGPARQCFTGLANPTKISVYLGTPAADQATSQVGAPSCGGIDGLVPGATLIFSLNQGPRPQNVNSTVCWSYDTQAIDGVSGLQLTPMNRSYAQGLTEAVGTFTSPTMSGCEGSWQLELGPDMITDQPISLTSNGWVLKRTMDISDAQACGATFTGTGLIGCGDWFPVVNIWEGTP